MRQLLLVLLLVGTLIGILYGLSIVVYPMIGVQEVIRPVKTIFTQEHKLESYALENLRIRANSPSTISLDEQVTDTEKFSSYLFSFEADNDTVTGLAHIPKKTKDAPVIVMFRGYVDQELYEPGMGTQHAGEMFAENGYITLAPDFLGFGGSDKPSENPMEERFQRYTTSLTLLDSIDSLPVSLNTIDSETTASVSAVGIWGHSNGGHIALVVLEVTGKNYPTTLWAPVTKPFPYSILYYTDESDDDGKALRKLVADFEEEYDVQRYSLTNYLDWISAPLQLHQGSGDEAVPIKWSDEFVEKLKGLEKDITYYTYPEDDHNFAKGNWNTIVRRDIEFFDTYLKK
jgi:dipeptidyl aminopeptidase/acylaminoacyl peptidase